ncbi:tetR family transcriptional regulator [Planomonospora sphaerica]|uniref:TetR family transcriptional regulator n=1 Tax=Planomonospora sphaerica TaxID=161355 RepID=A0A161LN10_9ACTN|nr:hypothetical protein [Planomonospora sphaerica]GAT68885.1 tetR family transcriptional regulator [Planomonospora sphaerica]
MTELSTCPGCGNPVPRAATGRPARYCSPACCQRAYRARAATRPAPVAADTPATPAHRLADAASQSARAVADALASGTDPASALQAARAALADLARLAAARDATVVAKPVPSVSGRRRQAPPGPGPDPVVAWERVRPAPRRLEDGYRVARRSGDGRRYLLPPGSETPIGYVETDGTRWRARTLDHEPVELDAVDGSHARQADALAGLDLHHRTRSAAPKRGA